MDSVFAGTRAVLHAGSSGMAAGAFPDVCLCPPPPPVGPVPTPLANTARARDLRDGSHTVLVQGNAVGLARSTLSQSMGNEVAQATGGGILSHTVRGPVQFISHAMDVLVEGQGVLRHMDMTTHNHSGGLSNTPPWTYLASMTAPAKRVRDDAEVICCLANVHVIDTRTGRGVRHRGRTEGVPSAPHARDLVARLPAFDGCLEVVAGAEGAPIRVDITYEGSCRKGLHPRVRVRRADGTLMHTTKGQMQVDVTLVSQPVVLKVMQEIITLLTPYAHVLQGMREYVIEVDSCGDAGSDASEKFTTSRILVRVYPPEDLRIAVSVKPWAERYSHPRNSTSSASGKSGVRIGNSDADAHRQVALTYERNGQQLQISPAFQQLISATQAILGVIEDTSALFSGLGWRVVLKAGFFEGTFQATWQWKPLSTKDKWQNDLRWALLRPDWKMQCALTLVRLDVKGSVGFRFDPDMRAMRFFLGIDLLHLDFRIELACILRVPLRAEVGPQTSKPVLHTVAISTIGTVEASCYGQVSVLGFIAEAKAAVASHITCEGELTLGLADHPPYALRVVREPLEAIVQYRWPGTGIKSRPLKKEFWPRKVLWEWAHVVP